MDRDEAIRLLKGGIEGIREFNRRRDNGDELPSLERADLEKQELSIRDVKTFELVAVNLSGAKLDYANLSGAELVEANLSEANLNVANLSEARVFEANLSGANLAVADMSETNLIDANLSGADLGSANLREAILIDANLSGADLVNARLNGAKLRRVNLSDADVRYTTGLLLDNTFIRHTRFDARASDPWSVLRRDYTGPAFLFNLIFLCTFLGVYAARAAFWLGINRSQQGALALADKLAETHPLVAEALRALEPTLTEHSQQLAVWQVLLAMDRGPWLMILAVALIVYNAVRWVLTRQVAAMRDAEERSGYSPAWEELPPWWEWPERLPLRVGKAYKAIREQCGGYRWCWLLHAWVARPLFWIAVVAFLWHASHWITEIVYLPVYPPK